MSKQAQVGLFTILGILAVFAVFYVISDFGTRSRGYKIGVHFRSAGGLRNAAAVYLSGVPIGAVDEIRLLPDYTTDVVLAIRSGFDIPVGSRFLIQAPITGEPTILIEPPRNVAQNMATYPREVLPIEQQPSGTNPTSISDLLEQGQGEVRRLDDVLAQLQKAEPELLAQLKSTLVNANELSTNANRAITRISARVDSLTTSLQQNLALASENVVGLTSTLNASAQRDAPRIDQLLAQLTTTSKSFGQTVDALRDVATNPKLKGNLLDTTRDFALTAHTFAELTQDLRNVTSNPQTQAQLRDTVAQLDATSQKVDSLVGQLGGTSSVYGVDASATPAPVATTPPPGYLPTSAPAVPPGVPPAVAPPGSNASATPHSFSGGGSGTPTSQVAETLRRRLNQFTKDLVLLQVRASLLSPARPGSLSRNVTPLLDSDRGPSSDFNVFLLPRAHTGLEAGVNDIGASGTSTANLMLLNRSGPVTYGGGIEYSRLGLTASVARGAFGIETRAYDLRHPTLDQYLNFFVTPKLQIFGGERDLIHTDRRTVFGLQFEF
jgi:phospholipid/cholesterol/gamma-HCH transport system substrate-binding protein